MKILILFYLIVLLGNSCNSLDSSYTSDVTFSGRVFEKYTDRLIEEANVELLTSGLLKYRSVDDEKLPVTTDALGYYEFKVTIRCSNNYYFLKAYRDSSTYTYIDYLGREQKGHRDAYRLEGEPIPVTCRSTSHIEKDIYLVKVK